MLLPELKQVAAGLGIKGIGGRRKSQLIDAIKAAQAGGQQSGGQAGAEAGGQGAEGDAAKDRAPKRRAPDDKPRQAQQPESREDTPGHAGEGPGNRDDKHEQTAERVERSENRGGDLDGDKPRTERGDRS